MHDLPMHLVDRMESLKDRKAGPKRRGYGAAATVAGNKGQTGWSGDGIR